ncbi:2-oxoacid:acceptor oxidoreductase subunit alpha [Shewanella sp. D64]|uniref:2-oxoacid:acceptor oxidoreductase subunit alpha n=1 Tax=unclassified Shewanella TaxID=196818 RepID=UPI0022BA1DFE|nr:MULTISPECIES: 2-oxoacid:acceptor oxidoreductase subunit alpha [unclassified Shewanella]MEC4726648.1 2-oxoacid:acceptor oxidoreductase subunit alpha [Shewanella sp. D64]MEC4738988.1 2-oxoacid:acceptor oxidoreductase subunit alpha [Shewanella sp. E94]WBJ96864.1 2-oxoacid:acceptor oxidoreductase subunit alpha [Shewanella sp. MTB7]
MTLFQSINEFVVRFANTNGTGSASANNMFAKAIMRMGLPVSAKNIFPSNIQGMPTWFEVRISEKDFLGRRDGAPEVVVAMNAQTIADDIESVQPGGFLLYDSSRILPQRLMRKEVNFLGMPISDICRAEYSDPRQRQLFKNVIYVGALAALLGLDFKVLKELVSDQFKGKEKLIRPNIYALELGFEFANKQFTCPLPVCVERRDLIGERILVDGNTACALGAVYGGATVVGWYPITPSTSVIEKFASYCQRLRIDPASGQKNYAIVQAEDELAAIGIAMGGGWSGARVFTATSGPGISLMTEFLGLAYFAEIPLVLMNVQRAGPSTGMPTRTQQSDMLTCAYASHGDSKQILLIPSTPKECFEFSALAFDLADRLQTPIIVMTDLDMGMNFHLSEPFNWDDEHEYDLGKVLDSDELEQVVDFGRYLDVDGDGICYRTLPGTHPTKGAFFTRGTSHNEYAVYTEKGEDYIHNMERLERKFITALQYLPKPDININAKAKRVGLVFYGSTAEAMPEAVSLLSEQGVKANTLRIRSFPFSAQISSFIHEHEMVFIIEQNRDGQVRKLLCNEMEIDPASMFALLHYDGLAITAQFIVEAVQARLAEHTEQAAS